MVSLNTKCTVIDHQPGNSFNISLNDSIFQAIRKVAGHFAEIDISFCQECIQGSALALFGGLFTEMCRELYPSKNAGMSQEGFDSFCLGLQWSDLQRSVSENFAAEFFGDFSSFILGAHNGEALNITDFLHWISASSATAGVFFFAAIWLSCKFWCSRLYQVPLSSFIELTNCSTAFVGCEGMVVNGKENNNFFFSSSPSRFFTEHDVRTCEMILLRCSNYIVPLGIGRKV